MLTNTLCKNIFHGLRILLLKFSLNDISNTLSNSFNLQLLIRYIAITVPGTIGIIHNL